MFIGLMNCNMNCYKFAPKETPFQGIAMYDLRRVVLDTIGTRMERVSADFF